MSSVALWFHPPSYLLPSWLLEIYIYIYILTKSGVILCVWVCVHKGKEKWHVYVWSNDRKIALEVMLPLTVSPISMWWHGLELNSPYFIHEGLTFQCNGMSYWWPHETRSFAHFYSNFTYKKVRNVYLFVIFLERINRFIKIVTK